MWGENDLPQYNALFTVAVLVFFNVITIVTAIEVFLGRHLVPNTSTSKYVMVSVGLGIMVFTFFSFVHESKYKQIVKSFNKETRSQARARLILVWLYITVTFVSLFALVPIRNA